jgi:hypothetical protein
VKCCILKVQIDGSYKDSNIHTIKIRRYDMGSPEDFLKWWITLNEQIKNNGFAGNYDMVMNVAQAMLAGRSLDAFVTEIRAQEVKNKTRLAKKATELTPQQLYDCAIFELLTHAFDTHSGCRDAFEWQHE